VTDLADFINNPQGITGNVEYCSMVVAFTLLQFNIDTVYTWTSIHSDAHQLI